MSGEYVVLKGGCHEDHHINIADFYLSNRNGSI
jgi:hypothetical protein